MNKTLLFPSNEYDFETLCCHIARERYQDNDARKYGRRGQKQWGVDIKAINRTSLKNERVVIQCKFKGANSRIRVEKIKLEIEEEFNQALKAPFEFDNFIYASTFALDTHLEDFADELSEKHNKNVLIWFIDDIQKDIEYYARLERLYIKGLAKYGVTVVNQDFIDELQSAESSETDVFRFYSGYSGHNEQWLGVLNNLDAPRTKASAIKERVDMLFNKRVLESKVAAVVYGTGGSGKSTLLRRLAIDYAKGDEEYVNWWVEDLDVFLAYDALCITQWQQQKHLIFIEDWYRNVSPTQSQQFFIWLKNQNNVLVLIGDRSNTGKYTDYLYDNYSELLKPSDNQAILDHVFSNQALGGYKELALIIDEVKSQPKLLEHVSISMILFVIAWQFQYHSSEDSFNIKEGFEKAFQAIIHSLLKSLEADEKYRGLGKALFVAAKIYSHPSVGYIRLIQENLTSLAAYIGDNEKLPYRVESNGDLPYQMDYLVHRENIIASNGLAFDFINFNHDVIAEKGIAAIVDKDFHFERFDYLNLLEFFISQQNAHGASLIWRMLVAESNNQVDDDFFEYLLKIFQMDNAFLKAAVKWSSVLKHILNNEQKQKACQFILSLPEFYQLPNEIVAPALNLLKGEREGQEAAVTILALPEFYQLSEEIISTALNLLEDNPEGQEAAASILALPEFYQLPYQIISTALSLLKDKPDGKAAAITILTLPAFYQLQGGIISKALNLLKDAPEAQEAAVTILSLPGFYQLPPDIITTALNLLKNEVEGKAAAIDVLSLPEFYQLPPDIITTALNLLKNEVEGKATAIRVLSLPEFYQLPHEIVTTVLNLLKGEEEGQEAAISILSLSEFYQLAHQVISTALNLLKDKPEGQEAAMTILALPEFYQLPYQMISTALNLLKDKPEGQEAAVTILALPEFYQLPHQIISTALNLLKDEQEGQEAAIALLALPEFYKLQNGIISTALNLLKDKPEGQAAAATVLALPEFYKLPHQVISTALNLSKETSEGFKAAREIIEKGLTKQTFLMFAGIRSLCLSGEAKDIELVMNIYQNLQERVRKKQASNGEHRLYQDLFWLPLIHIKSHFNRTFGLLKHYKADSHYSSKTNIYKVLKCYLIDFPEKNTLNTVIDEVQQKILLSAVSDINYQLSQSFEKVQLGHIDLAMQKTPYSVFKKDQAEKVVELAEEYPVIAKHHLYETAQSILSNQE